MKKILLTCGIVCLLASCGSNTPKQAEQKAEASVEVKAVEEHHACCPEKQAEHKCNHEGEHKCNHEGEHKCKKEAGEKCEQKCNHEGEQKCDHQCEHGNK